MLRLETWNIWNNFKAELKNIDPYIDRYAAIFFLIVFVFNNCYQTVKIHKQSIFAPTEYGEHLSVVIFVQLQVLGLRLGVDFTITLDNNDNNDNDNDNDNNNNNNPHLNFFKGTVLGVKEQGLGIRDKG